MCNGYGFSFSDKWIAVKLILKYENLTFWTSIMKFTHAITVRIPSSLKFEDKKSKSKIDLPLLTRQHQDLNDTLREVIYFLFYYLFRFIPI